MRNYDCRIFQIMLIHHTTLFSLQSKLLELHISLEMAVCLGQRHEDMSRKMDDKGK